MADDFADLFHLSPPKPKIVPFSFQAANHTVHGSKLQKYFLDSYNTKKCPVMHEPIDITNSCILPCGHVFSKEAINVMQERNPISCPLCRARWNVAYAMDPRYGTNYGAITDGGKRKTIGKTKRHKVRKSKKSKKSKKSSRKH